MKCTAKLALFAVPALFGQGLLVAQETSMPRMQGSATAITVPPPVPPADPNKVVLTIGSTSITAGQYNDFLDALPPQYQTFARGSGKRQFAETVVQLKLLSAEAEKLNLDKATKLRNALRFSREDLLARAMFEYLQQNVKVDDAALQAYYDAHKTEYESVKAKHILIRVKGAPMPGPEGKPELTDEQALAKAKDIRARLAAGGDFAAIAKTDSDDSGSGQQGGDLGEFRRGMMVPPFEEAAFSLKPGELSEPVKSPFGYHIIVVQEHKLKTMADVRADIEKALRPEEAKKQVQAMRDAAHVSIDDSFFGPAPAPAPGAPK